MEFRPARRDPGAFQQPITAEQALAVSRRAFGDQAQPVSVTELGLGAYNSTYRVDLGAAGLVILRVAPEPARQGRADRGFMRNEYAALPYLAPVAALMPRTLLADFTHQVIGRDYLVQSHLDGVPAPDRLPDYPRPAWAPFFAQLGTLTRRIHEVRGDSFGPVAGPRFARWSDAVRGYLDDVAADLEAAGLGAGDVREAADLAAARSAVLDEITEPRLLHGDLWTANVMVAPDAPEPLITGICDGDRAWWGDPAAEWGIFRAAQRPGTERDAFWETYGKLPATPLATQRSVFYQVLHLATLRLEGHRSRGDSESVRGSYAAIRDLVSELRK